MKRSFVLVIALLSCFRVFSQGADPTVRLFFDDFARYNRLDTTKWLPRTSAYLNDHFSKNPVSKNIVTFNGLSAAGVLNQSTSGASTPVDTLTTRPINLSIYTPADSVYLRFYVQTGGVGGMPVLSASVPAYFEVEFKDNNGNWQQAQRINPLPASQRTLDFKYNIIAITGSQYFHNNFQIRFRTIGKRRLTDDTWNLDYVFLTARRPKAQTQFDIMTSRRVSSLLQQYTAMPIHQFLANINQSLNDSVYTTLNNYENQPRGITAHSTIQIGNNAPQQFATYPIAMRPNYLQYDSFPDKPADSFFTGLTGFPTIKSSVYVTSAETVTPDTRYNDTISRTTELRDYFAYDDGSAESIKSYVFGQGVQLGQVAVRYDLNKQDRVKSILVYLPKVGNIRNTIVNFKIWNVATNGDPDGSGIFTTSFSVPDIAQLDNWIEIPVNPSVIVNGSFYVGWTITATQPLFSVGLDLNKSTPIRFTKVGSWDTENLGSLMIRVVMNNNVTGLTETVAQTKTSSSLYPNPATDHVTIRGTFETMRLLTSTGQLVMEKKGNGTEMRLETQHLKPGFYLVHLQHKNGIETQKLIIQRN